jgi:hypothetical protein
MRNNETGEFELLVGNRQLLSGFFIVVLLFAVAFSMGYIVGRNSSPSAKVAGGNGFLGRHGVPDAGDPAATGCTGSGGRRGAGRWRTGRELPPADTPPQPSTQPERGTRGALGPGCTGRRAPPPAVRPPPAAAPPPTESVPGSYWQVLATASQTSAEAMRQTMKDKGFPASLQPGPNNLIRVLIGPYTDKQSLGRAKTGLENAGVHPVLK